MGPVPLSVVVLVEIDRTLHAGGHVRCRERFAAVAAARSAELDLTVYFLGERERTIEVSDNVRYVILRPLLGTRRMPFIRQGAGDTDLAPYHPALARRLGRHDVVHATMFFSFGHTALRLGRTTGQPVVASLHTDLARFTLVYTEEIVRNCFGNGRTSRLLLDGLGAGRRAAAMMDRRLLRDLRRCDRVLVSKQEDLERLSGPIPDAKLSFLRRGIDRDIFHPDRHDRQRLLETFAIPPRRTVLLFVGRTDESKNVMTMARAARMLAERHRDLHVLAVGEGSERDAVGELLGARASLPGTLDQEDLPWIYASADIFVFPSRSEVSPNVVLEARACGLPVVVADRNGGGRFVARPGRCGVIVGDDEPATWADSIEPLLDDPRRRREMGRAARRWVEAEEPTWGEVLAEDLLPVWRRAAAEAGRAGAATHATRAMRKT